MYCAFRMIFPQQVVEWKHNFVSARERERERINFYMQIRSVLFFKSRPFTATMGFGAWSSSCGTNWHWKRGFPCRPFSP